MTARQERTEDPLAGALARLERQPAATTTRRALLRTAAARAGAGGLVAAGLASCTGGKHHAAVRPAARPSPDVAPVTLLVGLENLAVETYRSISDAAARGAYGPIPPALTTLLAAVRRHHADHAAQWNTGLTAIGGKPVTGVDATFRGLELAPVLAKAATATDVAKVLLTLENAIAATYLDSLDSRLQSTGALRSAARVQPVEMQHAAMLEFLIGNYPVPDAFAGASAARPVSDQVA
jgi:Ferritin-like domain